MSSNKKKITLIDNNNSTCLQKHMQYVFIVLLLMSFSLWLIGIFANGERSQQMNIFFLNTEDFLADFLNCVGYSAHRDPYNCVAYSGLGEKGYPPLAYVFFYFFSRLVDIDTYYSLNYFLNIYCEHLFLIVYFIYLSFVLISIYEIIRNKVDGSLFVKCSIAIACIVSNRMLFLLERGNLLLLVIPLVCYFLFNYDSHNQLRKEISLICLAIAAGLKVTPAVFGLLLIIKKQYRDAIRTICYGIVTFFVPFLFLNNGFENIPQMISNISLQMESYKYSIGCTLQSYYIALGGTLTQSIMVAFKILTLLTCCGLIYISFASHKEWQKILAITMIALIAPGHSESYNMVLLIPTVVLFLNDCNHKKIEWFLLGAFVIMMSPFYTNLNHSVFHYLFAEGVILLYMFYMGLRLLRGMQVNGLRMK